MRLNRLIARCLDAYERYEFHAVTYAIHNFCVVDMSNFYLDIIKDRLYCDGTESGERRSALSAIYIILDSLVRLLAPVLAFTSNEIWLAMPHDSSADPRHVMLNDMPAVKAEYAFDAATEARWDRLIALRGDVNKALELARAEKTVGKPLDAAITIRFSDAAAEYLPELEGTDLQTRPWRQRRRRGRGLWRRIRGGGALLLSEMRALLVPQRACGRECAASRAVSQVRRSYPLT